MFVIPLIVFAGCILGAGTHGSIKSYQYTVSKYVLAIAVRIIIASNSNIIKDTVTDYYNDGASYVTIDIKQPGMKYNYIFRYYGDATDWKASPCLSQLFICYAYDQSGEGGSDGKGKVTWYHSNLKKRLIKPFES